MDPVQIAEHLADKFERLAGMIPEETQQEKTAADSYIDPGHTLAFLKFFVGRDRSTQ